MSRKQDIPKIKTIMLGETTVGKTTLTLRLRDDKCDEQVYATVGATFTMAYRGNIKYDVWDTGGQERFRCLMPMYIRDSRIVIFVFDVTDMKSFDIINGYASQLGVLKDYYIIIIGNKIDLLNDEQLKTVANLTKDKLERVILKDQVWDCVLVSAKEGENFDTFLKILNECAKELCKEKIENNTIIEQSHSPIILVEENNDNTYCSC